jgi:hypothetical protein
MQQDALDGNLSDNSLNMSNEKESEESFDDEELGNMDNKKLFAEFKARGAGFKSLALEIRDDPNFHEDKI